MVGERVEAFESGFVPWDDRMTSYIRTSSQRAESLTEEDVVPSTASRINPVDKFVRSYITKSTQPILIKTSDGLVEYRQHAKDAASRGEVLKCWLEGGTRSSGYAVGLMSEIFARDLLTRALSETGRSGLRVIFAPEALDRSIIEGKGEDKLVVQKGGDLIIGKQENALVQPFALVDVSLNRTKGLGSANGKSPGISPTVELPVVVLGLSDFEFSIDGQGLSPKDYLKQVIRPAISSGEYRPLYGLDPECLAKMIGAVTNRLAYCCESFGDYFARFPVQQINQQVVLDRLTFFGSIIQSPTSERVAV